MKIIAVASKFEAEFLFDIFDLRSDGSILPLKKYKTEIYKLDSIKDNLNNKVSAFLTKKLKNSIFLNDNIEKKLELINDFLQNNRIYLAILGVGSIISPLSLQKLLSVYNVEEVLILGSAASFTNKKGDTIFCEEFLFEKTQNLLKSFEFKGEFTKELTNFCKKNSIIKGVNRTVSDFIDINSINKKSLFSDFKNDNSLDLELSYLAQVCKFNKIKFQAFKVITDNGIPDFSEIRDIYKQNEDKLLNIVINFLW